MNRINPNGAQPRPPVLSVVIPGRNHAYTLPAMRALLALPDDDLEVVIHDASDQDDLARYVDGQIADPRLRYHFTGQPLSLYQNFNAAAALATGDYVCFIGEDDGVSPEIVAAARWAKANNLDAVRDTRPVRYYWPDMGAASSLALHSGRMFINKRFSGQAWLGDVEQSLHMLMQRGGQDYLDLDLPKLYHGMVRRASVEALHQATGEYFKGLTPDIYAAVALAPFVNRIATLDYPLTIDGTAARSNAGDSARRGHRGRLEDSPHLKDRPRYEWPEELPRFYSVETIWAESALVAVDAIGRADLRAEFNRAELCARCLAAHPDYITQLVPETLEIARSTPGGQGRALTTVARRWVPLQARNMARGAYRRLRQAARIQAEHIHTVEDLPDNAAAMAALGGYLRDAGRTFDQAVADRL